MTTAQVLITIAVAVFATVLTRALPFVVFSEKRSLPKFVEYIGKVLPGAVFGLLVIYCFKSVVPSVSPFGIPELVASAVVVAVHLWRRSMLISVLSGTAVYMVTVQGIVPMFSMLF